MFGVITRRNWALRLSIVLNVCVLLYVCLHFGAVPAPWVEESYASSASVAGQPEMLYGTAPNRPGPNATVTSAQTEPKPLPLASSSAWLVAELKTANDTKEPVSSAGVSVKDASLIDASASESTNKSSVSVSFALFYFWLSLFSIFGNVIISNAYFSLGKK